MQADGNLVIYNASGTALWWTGTQGNSGAILTLADTGQPTVTSASGALLWSAGQLDGGQSLSAGASLFSLGRAYHLTMGTDGNLVEYTSGGTAVWSTDTFSAGSTAVMQADGNLVVYGSGGGVQWYSHTNGNPGAYLALSNSGALVIDSASGTVLATLH
jgi:hypothetical protein